MGQTIQDRQLKVLARCDAVWLLQQMKDHECAPGTQGHAVYTNLERAYSRNVSERLLGTAMNDFRFVFKPQLMGRNRHTPEARA